MPACVQCAEPTASLLARFGSGHVVVTRCDCCGAPADPYLEYGPTTVFIDLMLAKPRVYRHILYNTSDAHTLPQLDFGGVKVSALSRALTYARRFLVVLVMDAYLRWFYTCAHPYPDGNIPRELRVYASARESELPAQAQCGLVVLRATVLEMALLHAAVSGVCLLVRRFSKRRERAAKRHMCPSLLASTALLFSSASTILLLTILIVWDSKLPVNRRSLSATAHTSWPDAAAESSTGGADAGFIESVARRWNAEWIVRHLIGGMSAGIALGVVLPEHPAAGLATLLIAAATQYFVRNLQM